MAKKTVSKPAPKAAAPKPNGLPKVRRRKLTDYILDPANTNLGTERGGTVIEHSIDLFGPARSGVVDQDGVIRAGNHTAEQLMAAGIEDVIEVELDGREWLVAKRTDFDAAKGQQYAVADNRSSELNMQWDAKAITALAEQVDLLPFFKPGELAVFKVASAEPDDFFDSTKVGGATSGAVNPAYLVYITAPDDATFRRVLQLLAGRSEVRDGTKMAQIDSVNYLERWSKLADETAK